MEKSQEQHQEFADRKDNREIGEAVELAEQVAAARYSPWTPSLLRLYGCLLIGYLCGCLNGYDGSLMGSLNAMQSYLDYFNM